MNATPQSATPPHSSPSTRWPWPSLIAHRGGGRFAPENTLAAMQTGYEHGFCMVEYDVKLSRDGALILLHDDTIDRTSSGSGSATSLTLAELGNFDFGSWHHASFNDEPIPVLEAVARYTLARNMCSNIEIKPSAGEEALTGEQVARAAQALWSEAPLPPLLSSFSEAALAAAQRAAPQLPRALLIEGAVPSDWLARLRRLDCIGLNLDDEYVTQDLVEAVVASGHTVAVWTVNCRDRARTLLDWGCQAIVTDELEKVGTQALGL